jgi:pimeloyl-ACP methyl ester carboxylesterase
MKRLTGTTVTRHGTIAWTRCGAGRAIVLVHGTPFNARVWQRIADALALFGSTPGRELPPPPARWHAAGTQHAD